MTKLHVCGGRDFDDAAFLFRILDDLHREHRFREFMQGGARGADALAKEWAMTKGDLKRFEIKANWRKYGPAAGPIRNQQMLDWGPDLVVAFAGGTGTAGMVALARAAGMPVIEP
jgi:YspA, cpYpsA-related SLOG family